MERQTKTPEEMACGIECIRTNAERVCVKPEKGQCPRCEQLVGETLELIQHLRTDNTEKDKRIAELEQELAAAKRERDALYSDLSRLTEACGVCKHGYICENDCEELFGFDRCSFEWRGICPENTEGDIEK